MTKRINGQVTTAEDDKYMDVVCGKLQLSATCVRISKEGSSFLVGQIKWGPDLIRGRHIIVFTTDNKTGVVRITKH